MSDIIRVQSIKDGIRTEAIEFTGGRDNYEEIAKWSDDRIAIKGTMISIEDREVEIVMAEQYLRFPIGTIFVELGGMFVPMSKAVFEKRFAIIKKYPVSKNPLSEVHG